MPQNAQRSPTETAGEDYYASFAREALGITNPPATFASETAPTAVDQPENGFDILLATGAFPFEDHAPIVDGHVSYDPSLDSDPHGLAAVEGIMDHDTVF